MPFTVLAKPHSLPLNIAAQKLQRFNSIILLRLTSFYFSLASAVFMLPNSHGSGSPHWYDFDAFKFDFSFHLLPKFKKRIKRKFCN
ncbi:hypothetical protein Bca52824_095396 [Brassica carinata]|uniref:Uncharacterized protein n=1 Tax=Brassica carinata TaxID=52824 RepID=A0A8X7TJT8_BRACI|nr:hypothetical protein Bca52824_095396 [Brassica carinata]